MPSELCARSRLTISIRLDGELSESGVAALAAHLRHCAACATYAAEMGDLADRLRSAPLEQCGTISSLLSNLDVPPARRRGRAIAS